MCVKNTLLCEASDNICIYYISNLLHMSFLLEPWDLIQEALHETLVLSVGSWL